MRSTRSFQLFAAALALSAALRLAAQSTVPAQADATSAAKATRSAPKTLSLADYGAWNRITFPGISTDGKWMSYAYQPNDGDATLFVKQLDGDKLFTIPAGTTPTGGGAGGGGGFGAAAAAGPMFSDDGRFVGYYVNPSQRDSTRRGPGARGGAPAPAPGAQNAAAAPRATRRFELLDLTSGEKFVVPNAASFKFSKGSKYLAVRANRTATDTTHKGADLILRELVTGATRNIGNADLYDFDDAGRFFAFTIDATDRLGNGIYLIDLTSGETKPLNSAAADYDQLAWSDEGSHLAVLRGDKPRGKKQKETALLAWTDLGTPKMKPIEFDPTKDSAFAKSAVGGATMVLSEFTAPRFSRDGSKIFVGIKEQEADPARGTEPQANVDVWHWKDAEPQTVQIVRLQQDRRFTYAAVLSTGAGKSGPSAATFDKGGPRFLRLADADMRTVQPTRNGKWAIGRLDKPYRGEVAWGGGHADYYRVNTETGERTLIDKGLTRTMGTSPDSRWFLYLKDKHVFAYNLETAKATDLDDGEKISWIDREDDHPYELPIYGVAGWSKDGHSVLLNHKFDVWQVPLESGKAVNLTGGVGDTQQIRFRLVRLDQPARRGGGGRFSAAGGDDDDDGVDLGKPLTFSAYGEWTKKSGYWQVAPGKQPVPLTWEDRQIGQAQKAANADRLIFTRQTFNEFPDWWVTSTAFANPRRITDANPQLAEFGWGHKVLIDYTNSKGQKLQGTLTLPAGYEPGKKYPMLVYFYELMSNTHHQFSMPVYDDRPHISTYASNGYLVLQPDVVYEIGKPGTSALDCVTSAVKKVIELGYADPRHIGLQGHSWGGYESSFILTQTDLFAAVVTGAPPTDLVSFYDQLYKQTGTVQQGIMEVGQVRMGANVTPWTAHELYESQSPVHQVQKIKTPFLILQGTADGAVDWVQGLEFFNAARRNGKQVIFLSYPDEPHHLAKKENQKDFQIRMKQFFDHYLQGAPEPQWMTDGVPQTMKGGPIQ